MAKFDVRTVQNLLITLSKYQVYRRPFRALTIPIIYMARSYEWGDNDSNEKQLMASILSHLHKQSLIIIIY